MLRTLLEDSTVEVRTASVRALTFRKWKPSNISDVKRLAGVNDPLATALIRQYTCHGLQEKLEVVQMLLNSNPAASVHFLVEICKTTNGEVVERAASILESILTLHVNKVDTEDLQTVVALKDDCLVIYYQPGSGLANSTRITASCKEMKTLARVELQRRRIDISLLKGK